MASSFESSSKSGGTSYRGIFNLPFAQPQFGGCAVIDARERSRRQGLDRTDRLDAHDELARVWRAAFEGGLPEIQRAYLRPGLFDHFTLLVDLLVAQRALIARIDRALRKRGQRVRADRRGGDIKYILVDMKRRAIVETDVNLEQLAHRLDVLQPWERARY
jgi:hypothetical protein